MNYLSDMSLCTPAAALSEVNNKGHWTLIPYEAGEVSGVMIGAGSHAEAPEVTLPLDVSGWHAIYLGFWNPHHEYDGGTTVRLKLTGDPCFQPLSDFTNDGAAAAPTLWDGAELQEGFFKYADLTGKDLIIAQQSKGEPKKAYVAYFKLVPLSQEEADSIQKDREQKDNRILVATNDGASFFTHKGCTTKEEVLEQVEIYRYSDIGKVSWAVVYGDKTNYPSKIGCNLLGDQAKYDSTVSPSQRTLHECLGALSSQGLNPTQVALEHVHGMGLKFDAMFRMSIIGHIPPNDRDQEGLIARRPELKMLAKDGTALEKASYAFPEVQDFMLSLIREVVENFDIDGVDLGWVRGPGYVGYEKPFVDDFIAEHGVDPRTLDDNDIRAQRLRARYLTDFMRRTRQLLQELSEKRGRKIELSAWVYMAQNSFFYGLDVETWLTEELLDSVIGIHMEEFMETARAHNCKFYIAGREIESVLKGHERGVDGFAFWDLNIPIFGYSQELPDAWAVTRRMGHKDDVIAFAQAPPQMKKIRLKTVGGLDICHGLNIGAKERCLSPPEMLPTYSAG
jgi:hypothetical protein